MKVLILNMCICALAKFLGINKISRVINKVIPRECKELYCMFVLFYRVVRFYSVIAISLWFFDKYIQNKLMAIITSIREFFLLNFVLSMFILYVLMLSVILILKYAKLIDIPYIFITITITIEFIVVTCMFYPRYEFKK